MLDTQRKVNSVQFCKMVSSGLGCKSCGNFYIALGELAKFMGMVFITTILSFEKHEK